MNSHKHTVALFITLLFACGTAFGQAIDTDPGPGVAIDGRTYEVVAETDALRLHVHQESTTFVVEDLRNGRLWPSFVAASEPEYQRTNVVWQRNMGSLFTCSVVNLRDDRASKRNLNLLSINREVEMVNIPGGVRFDIVFTDYQISLSVEIAIEGSAFEFRIPHESVVEETSMSLVSITPLPFFGYARSTDDGYMLIPDGSGALYHYKPTESGSRATEKLVSWYAYAPEKVSFEEYLENEADLINTAYLPVFGAKIDDAAYIASVDSGDTDAYIHFLESGLAVDLSRMNAEFTVRHAYELYLSQIAVETALAGENIIPIRYDEKRIPVDRVVRYELLEGADATYSGMARAYRAHLYDTGVLSESVERGTVPLGLSLFGGIIEDRLLFDKYVAMTSFDQAQTILDELLDRGISRMYANVIGWSKHGYGVFPRMWPPDNGLGGRGGLRELGREIDQDAVTLYLQINPVMAMGSNGRFNKRNDVVKQRTRLAVRDEEFDMYLLNPQEAYNRVSNVASKLERYNVDGIAFEEIGDLIFHDYNTRFPAGRYETLGVWNDMLELSTETLGSAALVRGNIRQANNAEIILELPMQTSGYMVIDELVPFYQMVLHGSVYYTTEPENLFYDTRLQYLQWIETGAIPYYVLTYAESELLAFTEYNHLFTSYYPDWIDVAAERYHEFNSEFGDFYHLPIVDHRRLEAGVTRVEYADGSRIYLNYGDDAVEVDGITVEPMDYAVKAAGPVAMGDS